MKEFDDLTDLDDVFGPLRGPARSAELSQESATVELMVKAHRTSEGKPMFTSRRARIATLVATGVLGFGGMAAASPSLGGDKPADEPVVEAPVDEPVAEESVVEEPVVEAPVVEAPVAEEPAAEEPIAEEPVVEEPAAEEPVVEEPFVGVEDLETDFDEATCLEGNHGKTVSAVARGGVFPDDVSVTEAAHSSCGKDEVDETEVEEETEVEAEVDEPEVEEESEDSGPKAERPSRNDAEKSNNGNGKGKQGD